jgi:hypothetical protein
MLGDDAGHVTGETVSADGTAAVVSTVRPSGGAGGWETGRHDAAGYEMPRP